MNKRATKFFKFYAVILLMIAWFFFVPSCENEKDLLPKQRGGKIQALIESRQFVEKRLKAPATAEFSNDFQNGVSHVNDTTFSVIGYVDSQNGFGAMIRTPYSCEIIFLKDYDIMCRKLIID